MSYQLYQEQSLWPTHICPTGRSKCWLIAQVLDQLLRHFGWVYVLGSCRTTGMRLFSISFVQMSKYVKKGRFQADTIKEQAGYFTYPTNINRLKLWVATGGIKLLNDVVDQGIKKRPMKIQIR